MFNLILVIRSSAVSIQRLLRLGQVTKSAGGVRCYLRLGVDSGSRAADSLEGQVRLSNGVDSRSWRDGVGSRGRLGGGHVGGRLKSSRSSIDSTLSRPGSARG